MTLCVHAYSQVEVSDAAKDALAKYLAAILPEPTSGNRSSNDIYIRLTECVSGQASLGACYILFNNQISTHGRKALTGRRYERNTAGTRRRTTRRLLSWCLMLLLNLEHHTCCLLRQPYFVLMAGDARLRLLL